MFAEGDWDDTASAESLIPSATTDCDKIKEKVLTEGGKKKSLLRTLQTLGSGPEWNSCPAPQGSESEADEAPTSHPKKKKKRTYKRKRGQQANSQVKEKEGGDHAGDDIAGDDIPKVVKKQKLSPQVKASKNVNNTKEVTVEQKEGSQQTSIEKPLTRKQWKNRMKNKRKCKNKYQDKPSKPETDQVKESDNKGKSSTPKQMDPHDANTGKSKKSRKAEVKRQKQAAKKISSCIPSSETEDSVPTDGLIDTSNITSNESSENLSRPSVRSEHLMPSDKRKLKEKQKRVDRLRHMLSSQSSEVKPKPVEGKEKSTEKDTEEDMVKGEGQILDRSAALRSKMEKRLEAARFRYINEVLYTTTSSEAKRMFKQDPKAFEVYHHGFTTQVQHWPENPVDTIISFIRQKPSTLVVADFGCGDCKIARSVKNKVHSFDLASTCDLVTVCDMANVPIGDGTVDIAVFCLSLMGTNLSDFITEANRILVKGGVLKIAEVASRFENVRGFIGALSSLGFKITSQDTKNNYFYLFEFVKVADAPGNITKAGLTLKPCLYKKR